MCKQGLTYYQTCDVHAYHCFKIWSIVPCIVRENEKKLAYQFLCDRRIQFLFR